MVANDWLIRDQNISPSPSDRKYNIIYADPPWNYRDRGCQGSAERYYRTLTTDDLCGLNVKRISAPNAVCFLWATYPTLPDALKVMEAWGFSYKTLAFQWIKQNLKAPSWFYGIGHWTRSNTEPCLLGVKGKIKAANQSISQLVVEPRIMPHSRKPSSIRDKIVTIMGDLPRIELFATERIVGWDALGNALDGKDIKTIL